MENFELLLINIYLLSIFTTLIKPKINQTIYRLLKLNVVGLFVILVVVLFNDQVFDVFRISLVIPTVFLLYVIVQTEFFLILRMLGIKKTPLNVNTAEETLKIELIKSVDYLCGNKIGALITFEKNTLLDEYISSSYPINATLNSELLSTIFFPNTPLHDGAVVVRGNEIVCAGAYYPSSERLDIPKQLGSRHRAAIGISEVSDSLTIVVSEQTGNISVAIDGYLDVGISKESLLLYLETHLQK